jgi:hypothetical protein
LVSAIAGIPAGIGAAGIAVIPATIPAISVAASGRWRTDKDGFPLKTPDLLGFIKRMRTFLDDCR